jgi:hypothetical protein
LQKENNKTNEEILNIIKDISEINFYKKCKQLTKDEIPINDFIIEIKDIIINNE